MPVLIDNKPYRIMSFRDFIPEPARFWIYLCFAFIIQSSGGIYLSMANQMVGSLVVMQEDIMFAGYASFVGMTMIFPLLFPIKFRFPGKYILLTSCFGLIGCNLIFMTIHSLPILVFACFLAGIFRMMGFFECMSTIQLKITPTRDFAKFFPVVYSFVLGCIQLSGIAAGYMDWYLKWQYMHLLAIGLLLAVALCCVILLRPFRPTAAPQPIKADGLGFVLWSLLLMLLIFVLVYGEYYDWLYSKYIRFSLLYSALLFGIIIWRDKQLKRNYINFHAFRQKKVTTMLLLFTAMCLLLAVPNVVQNVFTGAILHYDTLSTMSLNWALLMGIISGALFSYWALTKTNMGYKTITTIGFVAILMYLVLMYFMIAQSTDRRMMYIPLFLRGAGNIIIYVVLTTYAARTIPFVMFFQVLAVFGFIRTGIGTPLGNAIVGRLFRVCEQKNRVSLSSEIDQVNPLTGSLSFNSVWQELQRQVMMVSVKEVFGYAVIGGIIILLLTLSTRYKNLLRFKMPRWNV